MSDDSSDFPAMFGGQPEGDYLDSMKYAMGYMRRAMRAPLHFDLTREEFAERFGFIPDPDVIGVCFLSDDRTTVVEEYVFIEDKLPTSSGRLQFRLAAEADIAELERLFRL